MSGLITQILEPDGWQRGPYTPALTVSLVLEECGWSCGSYSGIDVDDRTDSIKRSMYSETSDNSSR